MASSGSNCVGVAAVAQVAAGIAGEVSIHRHNRWWQLLLLSASFANVSTRSLAVPVICYLEKWFRTFRDAGP